jgi:curved DNA-binding protein
LLRVAEAQPDLLGQLTYLAGMEPGEIVQLLWIAVEVEELVRRSCVPDQLPRPESGVRSYEVNIPAGVSDGQRVRLAGQGPASAADRAGTCTW